jgi:hypothetical protein
MGLKSYKKLELNDYNDNSPNSLKNLKIIKNSCKYLILRIL